MSCLGRRGLEAEPWTEQDPARVEREMGEGETVFRDDFNNSGV